MPNKVNDGWYMILDRSADAVKIGAGIGSRRLGALQVGNPRPLELIYVNAGDRTQELRLHRLFRIHRIRGEWFAAGPVLEWLRKYRRKHGKTQDL